MSPRARTAVASLAAALAATVAILALRRWGTFHNETFDLAFYARMAWGPVHGSFWEPIVNSHLPGVRLSPVVMLLGIPALLTGSEVHVLLVAQALALGGAAFPIARIGARRFGDLGALAGALVWVLHPNLGHVGTFEMHAGTLAVLPLAFACDALDRRDGRALVGWTVAVVACREDLGFVAGLLCALGARAPDPAFRKLARGGAIFALAYALLWLAVVQPIFSPGRSSMDLHFGKWGGSVLDALLAVVTSPGAVLAHLADPSRAGYPIRLLAPFLFLPVLAPRWLLPVLPVVASSWLSEWPTATDLGEHYQTPILPILVSGAIAGAEIVARHVSPRAVLGALTVASSVAAVVLGALPFGLAIDWTRFERDARTDAAEQIVRRVPPGVSVQAPYALMPHLTAREDIARAPPPDRDFEVVILDAWHRQVHAHEERLLRTTEEPLVRDWLASEDYGLVAAEPPYLLLRRGADDRAGPARRALAGRADPDSGRRLTACLSLLAARREGSRVLLTLVARGPCPADLAIRIGTGQRPTRVDLLFDGLLSPAKLRRGDRLRSTHDMSPAELRRIARKGLRIGALRQSGARPDHDDPIALDVPLRQGRLSPP